MELTIYQVDAFSADVFGGNPAAIVPLNAWLPDATMQSIAMENNLAETAFFVSTERGYHLRWFTPVSEVDLCGHATLASAFIVFRFLQPELQQVVFSTRSGDLTVTRAGEQLSMDFPSRPPQPVTPCAGLLKALGGKPVAVLTARDYLVLYASEAEVKALRPDMQALCSIDKFAVIVSAPSQTPGIDFVSRFFAPAQGVPEDPVTGSAHCTLIPYWAGQLGKNVLTARQISARGGTLHCGLHGDRVTMAGSAVLYLKGSIWI
jgi:PhzF family phenazine biosynthesis protein